MLTIVAGLIKEGLVGELQAGELWAHVELPERYPKERVTLLGEVLRSAQLIND
jgi:hypothetical protein